MFRLWALRSLLDGSKNCHSPASPNKWVISFADGFLDISPADLVPKLSLLYLFSWVVALGKVQLDNPKSGRSHSRELFITMDSHDDV